VPFQIHHAEARGILSATCGFIAEAGFTHSLSPARNCTFGCTYCYVPTMRIYGGLKPADWQHWGSSTTFKTNAPELLGKSLRAEQIIYCSPLVDPYQPAEAEEGLMPRVLDAVIAHPPRVFVIQTRGPLVLRDIDKLRALSHRTQLRVSFSITTDREDVRRLYEPLCAPIPERIAAVRRLREAGIATYATLAPVLPCDPEALVDLALASTDRDIIADAFHTRALKASGATTREAALRVSEKQQYSEWHEPEFQAAVLERMRARALGAGRRFGTGPGAFSWLAEVNG
jgi:DNA repair photolyase